MVVGAWVRQAVAGAGGGRSWKMGCWVLQAQGVAQASMLTGNNKVQVGRNWEMVGKGGSSRQRSMSGEEGLGTTAPLLQAGVWLAVQMSQQATVAGTAGRLGVWNNGQVMSAVRVWANGRHGHKAGTLGRTKAQGNAKVVGNRQAQGHKNAQKCWEGGRWQARNR